MRCPNCNKFVSMDLAEPEFESLDIEEDGTVSATVRINRTCAECGDDLLSASIDMTWNPPPEAAKLIETHLDRHSCEAGGDPDCEGEMEVEEVSAEATETGTRKKREFGAKIEFEVKCSGDDSFVVTGEMEASVPASDLEPVN